MTEGSISLKLLDLERKVDKLSLKISKIYEEITFPHNDPTNKQETFECFEDHKYPENNGNFPHLFHTSNAQLNNISDMIAYFIKNCCCKNNKNKSIDPDINNDLSQARDKIKDLILRIEDENQRKAEPLNDLKAIIEMLQNINKKQNIICLTEEQIKDLFKELSYKDNKELSSTDNKLSIIDNKKPILTPPKL